MPYDWQTLGDLFPAGDHSLLSANPGRVALILSSPNGPNTPVYTIGSGSNKVTISEPGASRPIMLTYRQYGEAMRGALSVNVPVGPQNVTVTETYDTLPCAYAADITCQCPYSRQFKNPSVPGPRWIEILTPNPNRTLVYISNFFIDTFGGWFWEPSTGGIQTFPLYYNTQAADVLLRLCDIGPIMQGSIWIYNNGFVGSRYRWVEVWYR